MEYSLIVGDAREVLPTVGQHDLVFADPPFNIGQSYNGYSDKIEDFESFIQELTEACWNACSGMLVLYGPVDLFEQYLIAARRLRMPRFASGVWTYNFGQCSWHNFIDDHCHWVAYTKQKNPTWNPMAVANVSARVRYKDKRVNDTERGGMRPPGRVWGVPSDGPYWGRIVQNNKEKWPGHPNQLPQALMRRVILAFSNPGDSVLDPCTGSGTTGLVAVREGRRFTGIDISPANIESAERRINRGFYRFTSPISIPKSLHCA